MNTLLKYRIHLILYICCFIVGVRCYSLKGISIAPDVTTFFVNPFTNVASNAPATAALDFSELLKNKIRTETRLIAKENEPNVEFKGTLTNFRVTSEAPQPGEISAFNRLTVSYAIEFIDYGNPKNSWKNNFSFFANFASDQNLLEVQDQLLVGINKQLAEEIFNKAFSNW